MIKIHFFSPTFLVNVFILLTIFLAIPSISSAYFTTAQSEMKLGDKSALFLIDFSFGVATHEVQIPITATQSSETPTSNVVAYTIFDEDGNTAIGTASAIVLSKAKINSKGKYHVAKGLSQNFTLAVIFTPTVVTKVNEYRLQVTHLPFIFDGTQELQLNPSELQYYTTDLLKI
ncbi:MAG: hypothetical protein NUW00_00170 [Candidatus Kaiserbacteria bacterium]|nr:hypothetical protein [Candidatus Kaiserbacteria bacterium]